jgi:hypothetical protein
MNKLEKKITQTDSKLGHKITHITITRKDKKKQIDPKDIKQMATELHNKAVNDIGDNNFNIYFRVWSGTNPHTFNVNDSGEIPKFLESDDYYQGKVKNEKKFLKYYRVDFYVETFN